MTGPARLAASAAGSVAAVDGAMLAALIILAAATPGRLAVPLAVAAVASVVRLGLVARAARTRLAL